MEAAEVAAVVGKVAERLYAEDYDDQHEGVTEESVAEVMNWLELEIKLAAGGAALPPPAALLATGSGGKESCGSSVSRPASTVMASVDGWRAGAAPPPAMPWPWPLPEPAATEEREGDGEDGGLDDDADDEWVSQLLTDGPDVEGPCGSQ